MSQPFLGQIGLVGFNFAPTGWAQAAGQLLPISRYTALFSLLGTYYGGDGKSTFGLPDLQGRIAVGVGQGPGLNLVDLGEVTGSEGITLLGNEVPPHSHSVQTSEPGRGESAGRSPGGAFFAAASANTYAAPGNFNQQLKVGAISNFGGNLPHENRMPYLALNYIIAMEGVFPSRN